eukprot:Blabericola_migrator_1__9300@NODE_4_length_29828_cov_96_571587_g3_i0_p5_GENE_NODE_4_length_29828_cov_96_571587_g3_i0NODE_4_length_29828_cov_96_571587_g3_i0_p5_ORF_typecomplete_len702_score101_57DASH_Dam1/PF08653_10/4DASH_Dam1/PF08653_10/2_2e02TTKRSYEDQ/PF10212_9/5_1e03TTKRSYEDQ/PF10212_9/0_49_NODE_4_length_29828_cov_96_571587_g3_i01944121546
MANNQISVCHLSPDMTESQLISIRSLIFEDHNTAAAFLESSPSAAVCYNVPLFAQVSDQLGVQPRCVTYIQAEMLTRTKECLAVLACVDLGYQLIHCFTIQNFQRSRARETSVLLNLGSDRPVSFSLGWDSCALTVDRENDDFISGELFQELLEFVSVSVAFESGRWERYLPILPSASDFNLPKKYQRYFKFLSQSVPSFNLGKATTTSCHSLTYLLHTLSSRLAPEWRDHDLRFENVSFSQRESEQVVAVAAFASNTVQAHLQKQSVKCVKAVSVYDHLTAFLTHTKDDKSHILLIATADELSDKSSSEQHFVPRDEIIHEYTFNLHIRDCHPVHMSDKTLLDSPPSAILLLMTATEVHTLSLSWLTAPPSRGVMGPSLDVSLVTALTPSCRSMAILAPSPHDCLLEIWDDNTATLQRVAVASDEVSRKSAIVQSTPQVLRHESALSWLQDTINLAEQWDPESLKRSLETRTLQPLLKELQKQGTFLGVIQSTMTHLGCADKTATQRYPAHFTKRFQYITKAMQQLEMNSANLSRVKDAIKVTLDTASETNIRVAQNITVARNTILEGMVTIVQEALQRIVTSGDLLGSTVGWVRGPRFSELAEILPQLLPPRPLDQSELPLLSATQAAGSAATFGLRMDTSGLTRQMTALQIHEALEAKMNSVMESMMRLDARMANLGNIWAIWHGKRQHSNRQKTFLL